MPAPRDFHHEQRGCTPKIHEIDGIHMEQLSNQIGHGNEIQRLPSEERKVEIAFSVDAPLGDRTECDHQIDIGVAEQRRQALT